MTRHERVWLVLLAAAVSTGCASLGPRGEGAAAGAAAGAPAAGAAGSASASTASVGPAALPPLQVEIEAPAPLNALLTRYLDLVRLGALARDDVDDSEWLRLIDATPAQVRELLQTEGHFAPVVRLERTGGAPDGRPERVRLVVDPGPVVRVTRVTLEVEGGLAEGAEAGEAHAAAVLAAWRRSWPLPPESDFRNPAWSAAKAGALAQLRAAGYATATWAGTAASVDAARGEVRLFLVADSGPLFRWGRLQVEGLQRQNLSTLGHITDVAAGTPVTETLILDLQERLQSAGLFESVTVTLDTDPAQADAASVLVRLREAPLQVYTFGVGVNANTGPRASVETLHRRVFGRALTARNKLEWGATRQAWDGELSTHPGPRLWRNLLGGAIERLEGDSDIVTSQRLRLGRSQQQQRIDRLAFVEAERSLRAVPGRQREDTTALSGNYHGVWRRLDSPVLPTVGYTLAAQAGAGYSRSNVAESGPFTRLYGRLTGYLPLGRNWYGQARLEGGQVIVRDRVLVPDSQLFRAGGDDSVRGYGYRTLGPQRNGVTAGGRVLVSGSVELARPISAALPSVWGAVFIDAGNAADTVDELRPVWGSGVGVRWRSPVGPLRLDWAWGHETRKSRLHFSVGIAF